MKSSKLLLFVLLPFITGCALFSGGLYAVAYPEDYSMTPEAEIMFIPDTIDSEPIPTWVVHSESPLLVPQIPEVPTENVLWKLKNPAPEIATVPNVTFKEKKYEYEITVDSLSSDKNWIYLNQQGFVETMMISFEGQMRVIIDYEDKRKKEKIDLEWLSFYYMRYEDFMITNYYYDFKRMYY